MIADFYTKLLQGKRFWYLRGVIIGHWASLIEECVEGKNNDATKDSARPKSGAHVYGRTVHVTNNMHHMSNNFK